MYGIFFEDINYGADGGLYGEMIMNRSFEFPQNLAGWKSFGNVEIKNENPPFENNPHYARLSYSGHKEKWTGLQNNGLLGIGVKKDAQYKISFWARVEGGQKSSLRIDLLNNDNNIAKTLNTEIISNEWKKYEIVFKSPITDAKSFIRIFLTNRNTVDIEHISMFPVDTWNGRENGLRKDLAQALYDLNPGLFRFPGGCIVEGTEMFDRYDWKKSVGDVENRPLNLNRWQYTFPHRFFPDYYQSYGLGFYEYFLLAEDLGAEPLPILNCGLVCQYQNDDITAHAHADSLECFVQDALDLIEFANGDVDTKWGELRAKMGHPKPFNLKYLGVGNEQWGDIYGEYLEPFVKAIRAKYPNVKIVGSSGPSPDDADGRGFSKLWADMTKLKIDLVDEHYYRSPEWFLSQGARYDNYDRNAPKVFAGEYACHVTSGKNSAWAALCEAAFMTGLERNADVVTMATYAPLFAHVDGWQWRPDLIWFDNLTTVRSANYYIQQIYGQNPGTNVLSLTENNAPLTGKDNLFASAVWDANKKEIIIKVANTSEKSKSITIELNGARKNEKLTSAEITSLVVTDKEAENTIEHPNNVVPNVSRTSIANNTLTINLPATSFQMFRIKR